MNSTQTIRLGLIQHACPPEADVFDNVDRAEELIRDAARQGATLIATQELFTSHYFPQVESDEHFKLAEKIPGPTTDRLCALAKELNITLSASLFEQRTAGVYHNTSVLINRQGQIVGQYRKMHIPDDPSFYEKYYFTPGDADGVPVPGSTPGIHPSVMQAPRFSVSPGLSSPWKAHDVPGAKIGMLICWDQWFPEAARLSALHGAQILFYPTAIGWMAGEPQELYPAQRDAWITVQRAHAITNGVFVAAINRVGAEKGLTFWGTSMVIDPSGQIIAQADTQGDQVLIADCDLSKIEYQRHWWPFLRDRRIDAYHDLMRRVAD